MVVWVYNTSKCVFFCVCVCFFFLMDQERLNDLLYLTCTEALCAAERWYGSRCSFDIIIARWLLAVVCVCVYFFFSFSESTVLDGRFCRWQGTPWHGDSPYATCTLLNAKESKGCETSSFWFKFQREVCVCVCKLKRYVWNRVEDNCPFPLKPFSLILLKPATEMWLFAFSDNIYTICVFSHTYLFSIILCVSI